MLIEGYDQKGRVEVQKLNYKCEIKLYRDLYTLGCNAAKKTKRDQTKQLNQISHKYINKI